MAKEQVTKDKRRSVIVMLSLAAVVITAAVCVGVPFFVYSRFEKRNAIVERVKGMDYCSL